MTSELPSLLIEDLRRAYRERRFTPAELITSLRERLDAAPDRAVWIARLSLERMLEYACALEKRPVDELPLYGVPFAIKDNIDLAGVPTTAACAAFSYVPAESAPVVQKLIDAGAIPVGKTNLDQFATGLVGTRSPWGACRNAFDPQYISGGSSSGSAVAVALGFASFALGTDTAGSGRIPAAFNNLVGLKPTRGRLSTRGVVPACRSLDCVSIFALTSEDAARVLTVAEGFDADDPYSRRVRTPASSARLAQIEGLRVGVPRASQLEFFGDAEYERLFAEALDRLSALGAKLVEIDFAPFLDAARLLYEGPWVAERYVAIAALIEERPDALHPVTRQIIEGGARPTAADAFRAQYRLMTLRRSTEATWDSIDVLVTPTAGTIYRIEDVEREPLLLNSRLGYYTNFVNLLDLSAVAVPGGFRRDGLPFGITLIARAFEERPLLALASRLHRAAGTGLGALEQPIPADDAFERPASPAGTIPLAVCGAHMEGLPLNRELVSRGAVFLRRTRTAPVYRFYALPGGPPARPGLVRVAQGGAPIEVEVWSIPQEQLGSFMAGIPAPLGIGRVQLEDGSSVPGFLCEAIATEDARDITALGGWRAWLKLSGS